MDTHGKAESLVIEDPATSNHLHHGNHFSSVLTPMLLGDFIQSWTFLWRFRELLGLREGFSFEELLTAELNESIVDGFSEAQISMLQILISEFPKRLDRGRNMAEINAPPINDLTWPELARRYVLATLFLTRDPDSVEVCEDMDVVGLEADAQLLAAAVNKICGSLNDDSDKLAIDDLDSDKDSESQNITMNEEIPGWVQELEPVKKLKTNVGSKIRKCIYNSLAKEPPQWAREILEHSVSKEVYKANASGPTKKSALQVIAQFCRMQQDHAIRKTRKNFISISDIVMKKCRTVLHQAAAAKKTKIFCDLLGKNLVACGNKEGILGSPAMVSSLLYFRMIDMRLTTGAYCGSHSAFIEDVLEFWRNVQLAFRSNPELVKLAKESYHAFESLYNREVVPLQQKLVRYSKLESLDADSKKDIQNILVAAHEIPKAPWDEGVCRVCGIDKENKKVLLCDMCDAEYHTYCLSPPLVKVPKGNWFCPRCITDKNIVEDATPSATSSVCQPQKKEKGELVNEDKTAHVVAMMRGQEYWDLTLHERTILLKFFCDEMLDSSLIREHLRRCERSSSQHPKFSLRSKFLGIDSIGKLYWIINSDTDPWIIVSGISELHQNSATSQDLAENFTLNGVENLWSTTGSEAYSSWACYKLCDDEIKRIMDCLKVDDPIKRKLEDLISVCHNPRMKIHMESRRQEQKEFRPSIPKQCQALKTNATKVLELKYGPFVELETTDSWKKQVKGKVVVEGLMYRCECLEPILPARHHCLICHRTCFTAMEFKFHGKEKCNIKNMDSGEGTTKPVASKEKGKIACSEKSRGPRNSLTGSATEVDETQRFDSPEGVEICNVPVSSIKPLVGKASDVLNQLKVNLLDMEAAVHKEALRSSKACIDRRWAWRMFVKSASTIFEMVQALIVFEDMIKLEYIDCSWRYWSSLTAAANISTLSALSLRIYSFDAAIKYEKISAASNSLEVDDGTVRSNLGTSGKPIRRRKNETKKQAN